MIKIFFNGNGDGDWIIVEKDGHKVFSQHRLGPREISQLLNLVGVEHEYNPELTNDQILSM